MKLALLAGAAAVLSSMAWTGARAEMVYVTDPDAAYVADDGEATVVTETPTVVVEPRRRVIVVPRATAVAPPVEVIERRTEYVAPAETFAYRGTVRRGYVTTGYAGACTVGIDGIERCY